MKTTNNKNIPIKVLIIMFIITVFIVSLFYNPRKSKLNRPLPANELQAFIKATNSDCRNEMVRYTLDIKHNPITKSVAEKIGVACAKKNSK